MHRPLGPNAEQTTASRQTLCRCKSWRNPPWDLQWRRPKQIKIQFQLFSRSKWDLSRSTEGKKIYPRRLESQTGNQRQHDIKRQSASTSEIQSNKSGYPKKNDICGCLISCRNQAEKPQTEHQSEIFLAGSRIKPTPQISIPDEEEDKKAVALENTIRGTNQEAGREYSHFPTRRQTTES